MQKQRLDVNIYTCSNTWQICFHRIISMAEISDDDYLVLPDPTNYYYSGEHIYEAMVEIEQKYGDFYEVNFRFEGEDITLEEMEAYYNEYLEENYDYDEGEEISVDDMTEFLYQENIATEEEIELVANINGDTIETLNDILYARTGYRDYAQYKESV